MSSATMFQINPDKQDMDIKDNLHQVLDNDIANRTLPRQTRTNDTTCTGDHKPCRLQVKPTQIYFWTTGSYDDGNISMSNI